MVLPSRLPRGGGWLGCRWSGKQAGAGLGIPTDHFILLGCSLLPLARRLQAWRLTGSLPPGGSWLLQGPCVCGGVQRSRSGLQPDPGADLCLLWHLRAFLGLCRQTGLLSLASPPGPLSVSYVRDQSRVCSLSL